MYDCTQQDGDVTRQLIRQEGVGLTTGRQAILRTGRSRPHVDIGDATTATHTGEQYWKTHTVNPHRHYKLNSRYQVTSLPCSAPYSYNKKQTTKDNDKDKYKYREQE